MAEGPFLLAKGKTAMPRIEIYDTTLRDGSQAEGISFSLMDKLAITERLDSLGVDFVEGGYPAAQRKKTPNSSAASANCR